MPRRESAVPPSYQNSVFINCPFDPKYKTIFNAIVFAVYDAGFYPRCAFELGDASQNRLQGIVRIIAECRFGIHDISRTERDRANRLPRFNMPLELGVFFGCKYFGGGRHPLKVCLVMDSEQYRYQKFISDIAGQDVRSHKNDPRRAGLIVRDWLRANSQRVDIPDGVVVWRRFRQFQRELPSICKRLKWNPQILSLQFVDYRVVIYEWLLDNALSLGNRKTEQP